MMASAYCSFSGSSKGSPAYEVLSPCYNVISVLCLCFVEGEKGGHSMMFCIVQRQMQRLIGALVLCPINSPAREEVERAPRP